MGLTFLRHPSVSAAGICYGRTEVRLSAAHPTEIANALRATPRPEAILSSPSSRCRPLAQALALAHRLEVLFDDRLLELDFGSWEGRPWSDIPRAESDPWAEDPVNRAPPGGESFAALTERVRAALAGRDGVAVVTHAGPIRAALILSGLEDFTSAFAAPVPHATPIPLPPLP